MADIFASMGPIAREIAILVGLALAFFALWKNILGEFKRLREAMRSRRKRQSKSSVIVPTQEEIEQYKKQTRHRHHNESIKTRVLKTSANDPAIGEVSERQGFLYKILPVLLTTLRALFLITAYIATFLVIEALDYLSASSDLIRALPRWFGF